MEWFTTPRSYELNTFLSSHDGSAANTTFLIEQYAPFSVAGDQSHPKFSHLCVLVFEAVLEVVFVALPGYIVAQQGLFDVESQKFLANLNVMIFTPCLVFTKLAKQLTADKLADLAIIPAIFIAQTLVSWVSSLLVSKCFRLKKRPQNFIVAMGVFGNSNSLPISLVMSLSKTISGLHWDQIPGDNDNEVAARGILYLLIFQQLGQLLRWTWGFNVLLKPKEAYTEEEGGVRAAQLEAGEPHFIIDDDDDDGQTSDSETIASVCSRESCQGLSGEATPLLDAQSPSGSKRSSVYGSTANLKAIHRKCRHLDNQSLLSGEADESEYVQDSEGNRTGILGQLTQSRKAATRSITVVSRRLLSFLPSPIQTFISRASSLLSRFIGGLWAFMNPPLWAMLIAIVVASVPPLQHFLFKKGTFVNNSVIHGIEQSAGVAVPLILVVLGANLSRNTQPTESLETYDPSEPSDKKLLVAALISRMLLPTVIMAPLIALIAKFVPISILDDPIFVVVIFLLTGAPSALQLAQICQINNVYMGAISKILFQSYVVWILPSTLILVTMALQVVQWAV